MADENVVTEIRFEGTLQVPQGTDPQDALNLVQQLLDAGRHQIEREIEGPDVDPALKVRVVSLKQKAVVYAHVSWSIDDVQTKAEEKGLDLSDEEAEAFLHDNAGQIQDDMVERGWDSIDTLLDMGDYKEADGPGDEEEEDDEDPVVPAEAHSDDRVHSADFDAVEWFEAATDEEIVALGRGNWKNCQEADGVAQHCADECPELGKMFEYLEKIQGLPSKKDASGFECSVDEDAARAWIDEHRPHLIAKIDGEDGDADQEATDEARDGADDE